MKNGLWFLSTLSAAFLLVTFIYPNLHSIFLLFFSFFLLFFSFLFFCSGYLLLNRLTHCIQSLSDWRHQGGLVPDWNWGCQVGGIPLKRVLQNFELLNCWSKWIKFSEWVHIRNKLNQTKIMRATIGGSPLTDPTKFKLFTLLSSIHEIFRVNKYKGKIKFDKIWGCRNGGSFSNGAEKIQIF